MNRTCAAVALVALAAAPAFAWRADVVGQLHAFDGASAAVTLPNGDAVVLAEIDCDLTLLRLDAATGAVLWRTEVVTNVSPCSSAFGGWIPSSAPLVTDGDAIVLASRPYGTHVVIVLDAATGAERWRQAIEGGRDGVFIGALAIDRGGGVVAAGATIEDLGEPETNFLVVGLDGATGVERWRQLYDGTPGPEDPEDSEWNDTGDAAVAAGIDAAGNVLVAGTIEHHGRAHWYLFQFTADTGALEWRERIKRQDLQLLAVDLVRNEVVVAGRRDGRLGGMAVQRFDAASGRRRWRRRIRSVAGYGGEPRILLVAPDGAVAIAGYMPGNDFRQHAAAAWLDAERGSVRWMRTVFGPGLASGDAPLAFALDPTGDPVLLARVGSGDADARSVVLGLDADDGHERWRWTPAADRPGATIRALAVAGPDVLAAGQVGDPQVDPDLLAARLGAPDGAVRWETRVANVATDGGDAAAAVAVTASGDLVVAGTLENQNTGTDFAVVRVAGASGAETWRYTLDGVRQHFAPYDAATHVAVDPVGDLIAAGTLQQGLLNHDLAILKLDGTTGAERWRVLVAGASEDYDDWVGALETDAAGDVVLAGALGSSSGIRTGWGMAILKLDGETGVERWRHTELLPDGWGRDVAIDPSGDVVVAGAASSERGGEFVALKLAGDTGLVRWRVDLVGAGDYFRAQSAAALALAPDGDVIVAGYLDNFLADGTGTAGDWLVVRLAGDTGAERWRWTLDGDFHGHDVASQVALDGAGNVLVTGGVQTGPSSADAAVVQLDAATGAERWRRIGVAAAGGSLVLGAAANGDALVTGALANGADDHDLFVARLAAGDGAERWRRVVAGSAIGRDYGAAVVERADGAVVVVGSLVNAETAADFTVLTLAGADGSDLPGPP